MEVINDNLSEILVFIGLALLVIEVVVLGFSTFVLFFLGLACVLTGAVMYVGIIPESIMSTFVGVAVITAASAGLLWKPLKNMQNKVVRTTAQSDLIGYNFVLQGNVSASERSAHKYSGIEWQVKSKEELVAGTRVEVIKVEVGAFTVVAKVKD